MIGNFIDARGLWKIEGKVEGLMRDSYLFIYLLYFSSIRVNYYLYAWYVLKEKTVMNK